MIHRVKNEYAKYMNNNDQCIDISRFRGVKDVALHYP
jgi:hypothetical protein